jgi:hypothetical protein
MLVERLLMPPSGRTRPNPTKYGEPRSNSLMNTNELDTLEDSLGIVLPASYARMIRRLGRKPLRGILAELVCTDAEALASLNEHVAGFTRVAGLLDWPDDLFVIGEDGVGNYYSIRHDEENSPVYFFDHEKDEIQQCAESLDDFCKRIETLAPFDAKVLHRSPKRRVRAAIRASAMPDFKSQPKWTTDWTEFVQVFARIIGKDPGASSTVKRLNKTFGSRAVRWTGRVVKIKFGKYPSVAVDMPATPAKPPLPTLHYLTFGLRLAESAGLSMSEAGTPQVQTTRDAWRDVRPGDLIQFLMMMAPGHGGEISCIYAWDPTNFSVQDCGGHLIELIGKRSSRTAGRRRQTA